MNQHIRMLVPALSLLALAFLDSGTIGQEPREASLEGRPKFTGRIYIENYLNADAPLSELLAVDPNDGTVQKVVRYSRDDSVRVSPDGSRLVVRRFAREDVDKGLWIYKSSGEKEFRLSERPGHACWSPNGRSVLFSGYVAKVRSSWETSRIDIEDAHEERLKVPAGDTVLDCSPDGRWLITRRAKLRTYEYYVIHPDGTGERLLDASKQGPESLTTFGRAPRFFPDGQKVFLDYYVRESYRPVPDGQPAGVRTYTTGLLVFDVDGGAPRRLLERNEESSHYYSGGASWSPDGRAFALCGIQFGPEGGMFVELFDPDGKTLVRHPMPGPTTTRTVIDWR